MRLPLIGGAYTARSLIADAQRCVNLYPERNPPDAPCPLTHYPTPGLVRLADGPQAAPSRCNYRASNGDFYRVVGSGVYFVAPDWTHTLLGSIPAASTPVSLSDNGLVILVADGSPDLWAIDMQAREFAPVVSASIYGATRVDYLDTFFLLNVPGTNRWYISLSLVSYGMLTSPIGAVISGSILAGGSLYTNGTYANVPLTGGSGTGAQATVIIGGGVVTNVTITQEGTGYVVGDALSVDASDVGGTGSGFQYGVDTIGGGAFDPLDVATKNGYPDPIASLICMHREVWLVGRLTSEIWYDAGAADFVFQSMPGAFIEHGCVAEYSLAKQDLMTYWLSQDEQGRAVVLRGFSYQVQRISTHAIENEFASYPRIDDAIGFTLQQEGHTFYVLTFPTADKTWAYDQASELWHEWAFCDAQGELRRHRASCYANAYGKNLVGDWQNGNLYSLELDAYADDVDGSGPNSDGTYPITRIRSFPHLMGDDDQRRIYSGFTADMECGDDPAPGEPLVSLRWSDDRGRTYGNAIEQSLGATGRYLTNVQWSRLGMARDRVFELSWSAPVRTALNGAFIDLTSAGT